MYGRLKATNVCRWHDGTLRPAKGHNGYCRWEYDGQVFTHHHGTILDVPFDSKSFKPSTVKVEIDYEGNK